MSHVVTLLEKTIFDLYANEEKLVSIEDAITESEWKTLMFSREIEKEMEKSYTEQLIEIGGLF